MTAEAPAGTAAAGRSSAPEAGEPLRVGISLLSQDAGQFTGTATYVRALIEELGRRDQPLSVEVLGNEHAVALYSGRSGPRVRVHRATGFRVGNSRYGRMAALMAASAAPHRLSRQFSADTQLVHYPLTLMIPTVRLPTVATIHDLAHLDMPDLFSRVQLLWRRYFYESPARLATVVVTPSEHARGRIIESLEIAPDRVVALPWAVDHERFRLEPAAGEEALAASLGLPERYIFYPASLWPHKNHLALLEAVARTGDHTLHVLLTGAPFGRLEEVLAYASARGLEGRVRHLGTVPDAALPVLYRHATALAFPSSYEGFGLPPLEAMACGCPVASSRSASLAEVCGDAAAVLDPEDPEQMAQALLAVTGDLEVRRRLRQRGLDRARRFSWRAAADAHLGVYRRAVELGG